MGGVSPAVVGGWLLSVVRGAWLAPSLHGLQALSVQRLPAPVAKSGSWAAVSRRAGVLALVLAH